MLGRIEGVFNVVSLFIRVVNFFRVICFLIKKVLFFWVYFI